jgi:tricorn protease-like protein
MSTYSVKVGKAGYIRYNRVSYAPGELVTGLNKADAKRLVALGVAEELKKETSQSGNSGGDSNVTPNENPQGGE